MKNEPEERESFNTTLVCSRVHFQKLFCWLLCGFHVELNKIRPNLLNFCFYSRCLQTKWIICQTISLWLVESEVALKETSRQTSQFNYLVLSFSSDCRTFLSTNTSNLFAFFIQKMFQACNLFFSKLGESIRGRRIFPSLVITLTFVGVKRTRPLSSLLTSELTVPSRFPSVWWKLTDSAEHRR